MRGTCCHHLQALRKDAVFSEILVPFYHTTSPHFHKDNNLHFGMFSHTEAAAVTDRQIYN
jgi:hypothetical protein